MPALALMPWKAIGLGGVVLAFAILFMLYKGEQRHADKLQSRVAELSTIVDNYAKQSKAKREYTEKGIKAAERHSADVDRVAKRIEAAPLPGNCRSPSEVLSADI